MTDAERKATEAERIMAEIAPYCEKVERDAYEALLIETDAAKVLEARQFILAVRLLKETLRSAITQGKSAARVAPAVA